MSDANDVNLNTGELDKLIKAFKGNLPSIRIGILGSKNIRKDAKLGESNAGIGAIHEFGSENMPQRSFLRMPLSEQLRPEIERSDLFTKETLNEVVKQKSIIPWMKQIAICAEAVVQKAFETSGFGKWAPWKDSKYIEKVNKIKGRQHNNRLLDDTGQLRASITSEVK